jgi:MFS family permease
LLNTTRSGANRRRARGGTFASLRRSRNYRIFFAGQLASLVGTWMQETALPWLMFSLTHSAFDVGLLALCRYVPFTLLSLTAGALADRFESRRFLAATQSASMLVAIALTVLSATGSAQPWHLFVLAALGGTALVIDAPARFSFVTRLVAPADVPNAVSLSSGLTNAARVVGPALAGILIATVGLTACFSVNAASFVAVLAALACIRDRELEPAAAPVRTPVRGAVREGLSYVRRGRTDIKVVLLLVLLMSASGLNFRVLLPVLASDTFGKGATTFGILYAAYGLGALAGALGAASAGVASWRRIVVGTAGFSAALVVLAPLRSVVAAVLVMLVVGVCFSLWTAQSQAMLLLAAPQALRGRIASLHLLALVGLAPVGSILAGWAAGSVGTSVTFAAMGAIGVAGSVAAAVKLRGSPRVEELPAPREAMPVVTEAG